MIYRRRSAAMVIGLAVLAASMVVSASPSPADAEGSEGTTSTSWDTTCISRANGISQEDEGELGFEVTAPEEVVFDQVFQVRIAPLETSFMDHVPYILMYAEVDLFDVTNTFTLPMNATVTDVEIVSSTGFGWTGEPVVTVDTDAFRPGRISLSVPEVPSDGNPSTPTTSYQLPAIDVTLKATGPQGSTIATQMAGVDEATAGETFLIQSPYATAEARCWFAGGGPSPVISETTIVSGPETVGTAIDLVAEPQALEVDDELTLSAVVTAPSGIVEFGTGETILGQVEVDPVGLAEMVVTPSGVGDVEYWANYLGSEGYGPSSASVVVTVVPEAPYFSDVPDDHPFFVEIQWAYENGIADGYEDGAFEPSNTVARQAAAAFLYRLADDPYGPDPGCAGGPFLDVPADHLFCGEITWMVDEGLTDGYDDGKDFRPSNSVTRQAAAAFLYRLADDPEGPSPTCETAPFGDVSADHPFCGEIAWLAGSGITDGFDDDTFRPDAPVTRQAIITFLYRFATNL